MSEGVASPAVAATSALGVKRFGATLALAIVLVVTALAYWKVTDFDFVNLDDNEYVYQNPGIATGLTAETLIAAFRFHAANWHPVTWISHAADVELFGLDAGSHHAVNLLIHLVNVALLFTALRSITGAIWRSLTVASLFALHPLNVETVAWVAERKSLLSTMAWLLAIVAYGRWVRSGRRIDYVAVIAAFALGVMAKPMIVTLPLTLLILDVWPLGRLPIEALKQPREEWPRVASLLVEKIPLFIVSAACAITTIAAQRSSGAIMSIPFTDRATNALASFWWYLVKAFVPLRLCVYYPHGAVTGEKIPLIVSATAAAGLLVLAVVSVSLLRRRPYIFAGVSWFAITLLPVIGVVQAGAQAHADRYAYVPLIGIFVAVVWLASEVVPPALIARAATIVLVPLAIATLTARQVNVWRTSETLYLHALSIAGYNPVVRQNLSSHYTGIANALRSGGRHAEALVYFHRATEADPRSTSAQFNEAIALSESGRYGEAIPLYARTVEVDAANADAWLNLGDAYVMVADYARAMNAYSRTLALRPDKYADYGFAYAAAKAGHGDAAAEAFARLQSEDPALAEALALQLTRTQ